MTDAPKRIWVPEGADLSILAIQNPDEPEHEYILASEHDALIREAEDRAVAAEKAGKLLREAEKGYIAAFPPSLVIDLARTVIALHARLAASEGQVKELRADQTFYIDCEFDGHNGPLLSIAMVRGDGHGLHVEVADVVVEDPWVLANVIPIMGVHQAEISCRVRPHEVGRQLRYFIGDCQRPTIIADSPVDIGRFCRAISTSVSGDWASADFPGMTFIVSNVDCYPTDLAGAVQHNAWWDAMALRATLATQEAGNG